MSAAIGDGPQHRYLANQCSILSIALTYLVQYPNTYTMLFASIGCWHGQLIAVTCIAEHA